MNGNKIKENEITNVSSFIEAINKLSKDSSLYFRGHSNIKYELKPTIARTNKNLLAQEHKIYRETILNSPQQFSGKNTIESLTFMQHFGIPTRILDITENPLVALYFACLDSKNVKIDKSHFVNLKNENFYITLRLETDILPDKFNPAALDILYEIFVSN